jgi:hypothetical protein
MCIKRLGFVVALVVSVIGSSVVIPAAQAATQRDSSCSAIRVELLQLNNELSNAVAAGDVQAAANLNERISVVDELYFEHGC